MKNRDLLNPIFALIVLAPLALIALINAAFAEVEGDRYSSQEWGIGIDAPANWRMTEQTSYSRILLLMHRHSPSGKMLLSAERLDSPMSSLGYAERVSKQLTGLGFVVAKPQLHTATGAYSIEFDNGTTYLRQALLVVGTTGYSLTLAAPDSRTRTYHQRAFDYALRSIELVRDRSSEAGAASEPGQAAPPAGSPAGAQPGSQAGSKPGENTGP